jgi:hypothetical protein
VGWDGFDRLRQDVGGGSVREYLARVVGISLSLFLSSVMRAILAALWASTPQPHQVLTPVIPSKSVRSKPQERLR